MSGIIILAGHYGSGKTNLALNLMRLAATTENSGKVAAVDLDIINPYFRLSSLAKTPEMSNALGKDMRIFAPVFAGTNLEVPALPAEIGALFSDLSYSSVIVDVGGDESGAIALGPYASDIKKRGYKMLYVVNKYRPFTSFEAETADMLSRIESASKLQFTGIAANPNLGTHTDAETVWDSFDFYASFSSQTGLGIEFLSVEQSLAKVVEAALRAYVAPAPLDSQASEFSRVPVFGIEIFTKPGWEIQSPRPGPGSV